MLNQRHPSTRGSGRHQDRSALQQHITVTIPTLSGPVVDLPATQRMLAGAIATTTNPREQEVTAGP